MLAHVSGLSISRKDRWISCGRTLIVGYDVAHPGKATRDEVVNKMPPQKPSVVGISFNGAVHPEGFIDVFSKNRGVWPESVVITRDGVSEGQYRMVIEDELGAIKEACREFGALHGKESWEPKFTVIVTTKRHNARFVVDGEHLENPKPATVVDTEVVRQDLTEFYMQSHKPLKASCSLLIVVFPPVTRGSFSTIWIGQIGTSKPTAYQVIVDENDMSMDEAQSLLLALTFHHQLKRMGIIRAGKQKDAPRSYHIILGFYERQQRNIDHCSSMKRKEWGNRKIRRSRSSITDIVRAVSTDEAIIDVRVGRCPNQRIIVDGRLFLIENHNRVKNIAAVKADVSKPSEQKRKKVVKDRLPMLNYEIQGDEKNYKLKQQLRESRYGSIFLSHDDKSEIFTSFIAITIYLATSKRISEVSPCSSFDKTKFIPKPQLEAKRNESADSSTRTTQEQFCSSGWELKAPYSHNATKETKTGSATKRKPRHSMSLPCRKMSKSGRIINT
ncbi:unnamed protein product [Angiostrongylus costaricensis]|uniref:Piwi domain-containing protein n=1 Tax=Angiostrongylus costaricensis TaxID=334426 RepID=A0A158PJA2_ANGCS|nr:unnamed protein product [Angiostrongylus costaricensis]